MVYRNNESDLYNDGVLVPLFEKAKVPLELLYFYHARAYFDYSYIFKYRMMNHTPKESEFIYTFKDANMK